MSYISPRQLFIQDSLARGIDEADAFFLAELEFDDNGDPLPGSIYEVYRRQ